MKNSITLQLKHISKVMGNLQSVLSPNKDIETSSYILLEVKNNYLCLTAFSLLGIQLQATIPTLETSGEQSFLLHGDKMLKICKTFKDPEAKLNIAQDGAKCIISCMSSKFNLTALSPVLYDKFPEWNPTHEFRINAKTLDKLIIDTKISLSKKDARGVLSSIHFSINDSTIQATTTDSHRISVSQADINSPIENIELLIPGKNADKLRQLLNLDEDIRISFNTYNISFYSEEMVFTAKLVNEKFPDILSTSIIPKIYNNKIEVNLNDLREAISRAIILTNSKIAKGQLIFKDSSLIITAENEAHENAREEIVTKNGFTNTQFTINLKYVSETLQSFKGSENIYFLFEDTARSITIAANKDIEHSRQSRYIIAPMNF
ncbi:MAG: DNA polymerase III subunit beta [Psittacicella sp.]